MAFAVLSGGKMMFWTEIEFSPATDSEHGAEAPVEVRERIWMTGYQ